MAKEFSVSEVREIMEDPARIRNISVIAHVDHGKSTLTDSLISRAGLISRARQGDARFMDTRADEQERSITIKSTSVSLAYAVAPLHDPLNTTPYLVNLIDSPGHVDFSSEVTTALRTTDGALVVVDCVEGVCTQTETVLRQSLVERVKPVLFLNKVDRVLSELRLPPEEAYLTFRRVIENVNVIISTYRDASVEKDLGTCEVAPENGTVAFGSGLHAWAFTLEHFYVTNYSADSAKAKAAAKRLWGDYFYNTTTKKFSRKPADGPRGFNHFVMAPLIEFFEAFSSDEKGAKARQDALVAKYQIERGREMLAAKTTKERVKSAFFSWIPAGVPLLDMIVTHLPDPKTAQRYRATCVHGPSSDFVDQMEPEQLASPEHQGIANCDPAGPLMIFISKMVPSAEPGRFYAFGRVYSGTIEVGDEIFIHQTSSTAKPVKVKCMRVCLMMGRFTEQLNSCPAGNMVGLTGVDKFILKTATVSSSPSVLPFKMMQFSVAAVVQQAVSVKRGQELPKLIEGLNRLSKSDPLIKIISDKKTGEHIIACAGELHLEICMKDLREEYCAGVEIVAANPIVTYCESAAEPSSGPEIVCAKSANKHNRLFVRAEPLSDELVEDLLEGKVNMEQDPKERARYLQQHHDWPKGLGRKVWSVGHIDYPITNILVDCTKSIQNLSEVKDSIVAAFTDYTAQGVLCNEPVRGMRFDLMDATLHVDSTHRGANQMVTCAHRALSAAHLASKPMLIEPVFSVEIQVPAAQARNAVKTINQAKGMHLNTITNPNTPIQKLIGELPVANSFGFVKKLRADTAGMAFPTLKMDRWQKVDGNILGANENKAKSVVIEVRERKGLSKEIPQIANYHDKL